MVACGSYLVFAFPTPVDFTNAASPDAAWEALPARAFHGAADLDASAPRRAASARARNAEATDGRFDLRAPGGAAGAATAFGDVELAAPAHAFETPEAVTSITSLPPVVPMALGGDGPVAHLLVLTDGETQQCISITREMARRGVLLGRYGRCDVSGDVPALRSDRISRVHAVLLEDERTGRAHVVGYGELEWDVLPRGAREGGADDGDARVVSAEWGRGLL